MSQSSSQTLSSQPTQPAMDDNENPAPANNGQRIASFKIPYVWDANSPKFTSDNYEDLMTFVDHVGQILKLAGIEDDAQKKEHFTSYLPTRKKDSWRSLPSYTEGSYEDFLKEVYLSYPEIKSEKAGTIENLKRLCARNKGIMVTEEGRLRRFGVEFLTEVNKLMAGTKALLTNQLACDFYYEALESSFTATLKMSINSAILIKAQVPGLLAAAAAANADGAAVANNDDDRAEDPVKIQDLIKLAETLAKSQKSPASTLTGSSSARRPDSFPLVKSEPLEEKFEEVNGAIAQLRDQYAISQKASELRHTDLLKSLQQLAKDSAPTLVRDPPPHFQSRSNFAYNTPGQSRWQSSNEKGERPENKGCYYCEETDHFSRDCKHKAEHIDKGLLAIENGKHKLGDGNYIPGGPGTQKQRVDQYWKNKTVSQNWVGNSSYESYDEQGRPLDFADTAMDEIRTLKVQLARARQASVPNQIPQVVQPTYMTQNQPMATVHPSIDLNQTLHSFLMRGLRLGELPSTQEQFTTTRTGPKTGNQSAPNF